MTDEEIVKRAKDAEKKTSFGELVHSPISKGVNSAYGIGFIEGMVEYRNYLQEEPTIPDIVDEHFYEMLGEEPVSEDLEEAAHKYADIRMSNYETAFYAFMSGAKWKEQQIISKAIDGEVGYWNLRGLSVNVELPLSVEEGDRVKVIVIEGD